jgi:hypothetical protein
MNAIQAVYLVSSLLAGVILAGLLRYDPGGTLESRRIVSLCLATLILALLLVGVVSHTFVRHIVQVIPPAAALVLVARGSAHGPSAAAPIFTFWFGVMVNIWMFLLGIARMFTGTFTLIEIVLTIAMAIACGFGFVAVARSGGSASVGQRVTSAIAFAVAQLLALVASFHPMFR